MIDSREAIRTWLALLATSRTLEKAVDGGLRFGFGHSISRFDVLSTLERAGASGLRAGALTERLMVTDGATTQVTSPLIREGLVRRMADPTDRRAAVFSLTKKGEGVFAEMAAEHKIWINEAFAALSPAQMKTLRRLLSRIEPHKVARTRNVAA
jgi:DNA-binding MarR family transcriptional regulator